MTNIERHSRARQIDLGRSLADRKKIYLDTRFWIIARDAFLGVRDDKPAAELLAHLRCGVKNGQLVCPISHSLFFELFKQPYKPERRIGTAELIDELSLGISIVPPQVVVGTEIHRFMLEVKGGTELHPMQELIWTKVAYVLGDQYLSMPDLSQAKELDIQKQIFDHFWDKSLAEMIEVIGDSSFPKDRFQELSQNTNAQNAAHKDELRSFAQTYDIELRGAVEVAGDMAADIMLELAEKEAGRELLATEDERAYSVNMCRNLLYHALKKPETKSALRSIHIGASIHAGMRWDKTRQFKPNDYYDFEHATVALGYCDAFFTDKPLYDLVTRPQLDLETVNGCRVVSDIQIAADLVRQSLS